MSSASTFVGSYLPSGQSIVNQTGEIVSWLGRSVVLSRQTRLVDRLRPYTKLALHNAAGYLIGGLPGCIVGSAIEVFFLDSATYAIVYKLADGAGVMSLKTFELITGATMTACAAASEGPEKDGCKFKEQSIEDGYVLIGAEDLSALIETHKSYIQQQRELETDGSQVQQQQQRKEGQPRRPKVSADELERSLEKFKKDFFCKKK